MSAHRPRRIPRVILVNGLLALVVWSVWSVFFGPRYADLLGEHWPVALTMAFGSLVGGGTSEGGGAIAFPVLTKLLAVPADTARTFSFAIQSIGMTAASLSILLCRIPIERIVLGWGAVPGVAGVLVSTTLIAPLVPLPVVRVLFTMLLVSLAVALILQLRSRTYRRHLEIPVWGAREQMLVAAVGLAGGLLSGVAGVGENTVMFVLLVLLFRVSEKITTPTTVVLMTIVSIAAFLSHVFLVQDFEGVVVEYWIVAAPVVALGAPLGAYLCTLMSPTTVRGVLIVLIAAELVSTVVFVPFTPVLALVSAASLAVLCTWFAVLLRSERYARSGGSESVFVTEVERADRALSSPPVASPPRLRTRGSAEQLRPQADRQRIPHERDDVDDRVRDHQG